jgi:hypothetical protein
MDNGCGQAITRNCDSAVMCMLLGSPARKPPASPRLSQHETLREGFSGSDLISLVSRSERVLTGSSATVSVIHDHIYFAFEDDKVIQGTYSVSKSELRLVFFGNEAIVFYRVVLTPYLFNSSP